MAMCDESGALLADSADELLESDEEMGCGSFSDAVSMCFCAHLKTLEVMEFPVL